MPLPARLGLLTVIAAVALAAFLWPSGRLEPRDLPVGVVGTTPAALADTDRFDVTTYASPAAAREGVRDREVYGALAGGELYVATGASPAVAQLLQSAAPPQAQVTDLAPGTGSDPRVATLGALALPLTLLGIVAGIIATLTATSLREKAALLLGGATVAGLIGALYAQTWLDALPGPWLGIAGVVALAVAAIGATVTGLAALIGKPGIGLAAATMMLVANPWSGISSAPELLPDPAGLIGSLLPTGAAGSLLRSVAYFDGAGGAEPLLVLALWLAIGISLLGLAQVRPAARRSASTAARPSSLRPSPAPGR